jgi:hypothetical protein
VLGKVQLQIYSENRVRFAVGLSDVCHYIYVKCFRLPEMIRDCLIHNPLYHIIDQSLCHSHIIIDPGADDAKLKN